MPGACLGNPPARCARGRGTPWTRRAHEHGYNCDIISLLIWILYFVVPSEAGLIDGIPVGRLGTIGLLLVAWLAAHRVRIAGAGAAAALTVAAVVASLAVPGEGGFYARYYATAAAGGAHERSIEQRNRDFTRVDRRLDFIRGERDLPLAFFNDHTRFNFMRMGEPDRRYLEFAAAWSGWLLVPEGGERRYYLDSPGATAHVAIDGLGLLTTRTASGEQQAVANLTAGWHRLHVTLSSPYGGTRTFSAGEIVNGARQPFSGAEVRTERLDDRQQLVSRIIAAVKPAADTAVLAWLGGLSLLVLLRRIGEVWQRGPSVYPATVALFLSGGAVEALRFAWPWAERFRIMNAGDDPMTYEGYARDILLNGILMNGGAPPGQGEPFYYQALYPYVLAATHAVFGEGFFGALFLQRFLVALTAVGLMRIAIRIRGESIWAVALTIAALFSWWKFAPIAADLLNESLYIPLLVAWTGSLIAASLQPSTKRAAITGVLAGFAALTRSTLTLSWLVVWPALAWRWWRTRRALLAIVLGCSLAVFSLMGIRNQIVSGKFVTSPTGMGITLLGGNQPPPEVVMNMAARKALYDRLGITGYTAEVVEYAISAPGPFAANMGRKALFALGFYEPYAEGWGYSPVYIATWIGAACGLVLLLRTQPPDVAVLWPLLIALTQYVAVVLVYPKGERLILPVHTLLIPYAAVAAQALWLRVTGR
jgi:hypothetical protein